MNKQAFLISFEGIEGTGKSTQCRLLCNYLKNKGLKVMFLREPGSSPLGEKIRQLLLFGKGNLFAGTLLSLSSFMFLLQHNVIILPVNAPNTPRDPVFATWA